MHPFYQTKHERFSCFSTENISFPAHLHRSVELLFVIEGALEVTVQDQTMILNSGGIALIFPDMLHSYQTDAANKVFLCIFNPEYVGDYYNLFRGQQPQVPFLNSEHLHPDVSLGISRMLEFNQTTPAISEAWLHLILTYLLPNVKLSPLKRTDNTELTHMLIHYISQHFQEALTLERIAGDLHFNKYYISRIFAKKLHCGFYDYLNRIRLDYAAHLILKSDQKLTGIWQESGFESQRTFNRAFQKEYGMTPTEYRKIKP
ncbi:MAG TPA: helix-turn-helix domain-containing protein [Candidatus Pelethocola excrementipullorum]|nr:helix-turn-helix domain-containing protein [Candidatus Pelethocola excrementipullorum]